MSAPPAIWRASETTLLVPGVVRVDEVIYDETPGYVGCTVRSYNRYWGDGHVSRRYEKVDGDGGWRRVA
jgi:hypothetical protein